MFLAFAGQDRDRAHADLVDPAIGIADRDHVAWLDRTVHQQDDAGDQVAYRFLHAEADGEAECAGEDRQRGQVNTEDVETEYESTGENRDNSKFLA